MIRGLWNAAGAVEQVLLVALIVLLAVLLLSLVSLTITRAINRRREERARALGEQLQRWLADQLSASPPRDAPAAASPFETPPPSGLLRRVLIELGEQVVPEDRLPLRALFLDSGLVTLARRDLRGRRWRRLRLIREARALMDPADVLATLAQDEERTVSSATFEALCELGRIPEALRHAERLEIRSRGRRELYVDALAQAGEEHAPLLLAGLEGASPAVQQILLVTLGRLGETEVRPALLAALEAEETELRIAALRGLGELGDPETFDPAWERLADPRWEVRAQAARVLPAIDSRRAAEALVPALQDESEWVRYDAAEALTRCGSEGETRLEQAAERSPHARSALGGMRVLRGSAS